MIAACACVLYDSQFCTICQYYFVSKYFYLFNNTERQAVNSDKPVVERACAG